MTKKRAGRPSAVGAGPDRFSVPASLRPAAAALLLPLALLVPCSAALAGRGAIDDPGGRMVLHAAFRQVPTYQDLAETEASLTRMASLLCDATEGQVRIQQIHLTSSPASEDLAALWFHDADAASAGPYDSAGGDLHRLGAHMDVFSSARLRPDRLVHLLAHHAFGLGDQYDDQRRRGGACGIGPGFEAAALDERNHSLMQGGSAMRCDGGPASGRECSRDDECATAVCDAVLGSEFSTSANHDRVRGQGGVCPKPSAVSRLGLAGLLAANAGPETAFDPSSFLSARATSAWHREIEVLGPGGALPGRHVHLYLSHTAGRSWQLTVGVDAGDPGGRRGRLQVIKSWDLTFNEDFSLASTRPADMRFLLATGEGNQSLEIAIDLGVPNPDGRRSPGQGYDGLQMVRAGSAVVEVTANGVVGCSAPWCASSWNQATSRWEVTEQSLLHNGAGDWATLAANLPFLVPPAGDVAAAAPSSCRTPPEFLTDVMGADQVVFVLDASRSMGARVDGRPGEVCANRSDDDSDGEVDESDCADSRLDYEEAAVRAFLAVADSRTLQAGLVALHGSAETLRSVEEMTAPHRAAFASTLVSLEAEGDSALGAGLALAQENLAAVERVARSRTIVLASDGASNFGPAPGQEPRSLDPLLYRVFTVAIGNAADKMTLAAVAAQRSGVAYATDSAAGTPAIFAEIAARHGGSALLLERTPFDLVRTPAAAGGGPASLRDFEFPVEEKAGELVVFFGSRNSRLDDWQVMFELEGPGGERIDDSDARSHAERGFRVLRIQDPKPGRWRLRVVPGAGGVVSSEVLAWTSLDNADLFVDADPRLASVSRPVRLFARPSYVSDIDGDVTVDGTVRRPDGSVETVVLARDPLTQEWGGDFDRFAGRGLYEVRLRLRVGEESRPALGEPIFPGTSRLPLRVVPFERTATASFYLADGPERACSGDDCDGDGLGDRIEAASHCPEDVDGDGIPNRYDADSDNDEIPDGEDGAADRDKDGLADFCDPESTPPSLAVVVAAEEAALASACGSESAASRDSLQVSLAGLRRIQQTIRGRQGIPEEVRKDVLADLERVISLKKQAVVIGEVLPEFCRKYQERLTQALLLERTLGVRVDPWLVP